MEHPGRCTTITSTFCGSCYVAADLTAGRLSRVRPRGCRKNRASSEAKAAPHLKSSRAASAEDVAGAAGGHAEIRIQQVGAVSLQVGDIEDIEPLRKDVEAVAL